MTNRSGRAATPIVFTAGSAIGAMTDYLMTLALTHWLGMLPSMALGVSMCLSASLLFLFHDRLTFRARVFQTPKLERYGRFLGLAVFVYLLRAAALMGLVALKLPLWLALIVAIVVAWLVNFALSSGRVFT